MAHIFKSPIMPPHYAGADAVISNSLVTEGCVVHGLVRHSVLYAGVRIEPGAVVEDSIIMPNSVIERGAVVQKQLWVKCDCRRKSSGRLPKT